MPVPGITGEGDDEGVISILSCSLDFFLPVHKSRISFTNAWNSSVKRNDCQLWVEFDFLTSGRNTSYPSDNSRASSSIGASVGASADF